MRPVIADAVEAGMDGLILCPGSAIQHADLLASTQAPALILRLDQTTMWRVGSNVGYPQGHTRLMASVEEAVQLGADAVITYLFTCHGDPALETQSIEIASRTAQECRRWGMPLILEPMAARGGLVDDVFDPDVIFMNCRIAAEIGADIVKTDWSGDARSFRRVVDCVDVPVMVAGGARLDTDKDVLAMIGAILQAKAQGVLFGRNIFQSKARLNLLRNVRDLIHNGGAPKRPGRKAEATRAKSRAAPKMAR